MFGFVNVYKDELKIKDYDMFRAYYCGLCKAIGRRYSQVVRLGLSYDMTFFAILADSLSENQPEIKKQGCIKNRGKRNFCTENPAINFSSDASVILAYHKLKDDLMDNHSIKALFGVMAYYFSFKKASKKHPEMSEMIENSLKKLSVLENEGCSDIDVVADPFASLCGHMFEFYDKSLYKTGYNIGRLIYILDAYKDISDDIKSGSYNPYVCKYTKEYLLDEKFKKSVMGSLNMTLTAISDSYSELKIYKNKDILDNIIYLGLRFEYDKTFNLNGGKK